MKFYPLTDCKQKYNISKELSLEISKLISNKYSLDLINHVRVIISNLYSCHRSNMEVVSYSRKKDTYKENTMSYSSTIRVIDFLDMHDYISTIRGFHDPLGVQSTTGHMVANKKLINLIELNLPIAQETVETKYTKSVYINIKDSNDEQLEVKQTQQIKEIDNFLHKYNKAVHNSFIKNRFLPLDHPVNCNLTTYRVFRDNTTNFGRLYGGFWTNCNSNFRKDININNSETVELDYKSQHVFIAYSLVGLDYTTIGNDPYYIPTIDNCETHRKLIKLILLNSLTATNKNNHFNSVNNQIFETLKDPSRKRAVYNTTGLPLKKVIELVLEHHKPISKLFFTELAGKLQFLDSELMIAVLRDLLEKDIVGLGVHDSCIVEAKFETVLKEIMINNFKKMFNSNILVEAK